MDEREEDEDDQDEEELVGDVGDVETDVEVGVFVVYCANSDDALQEEGVFEEEEDPEDVVNPEGSCSIVAVLKGVGQPSDIQNGAYSEQYTSTVGTALRQHGEC